MEPTQTKVMEFGKFAVQNAERRGKRVETFDFLGLTHYCSKDRDRKGFRMKRVLSVTIRPTKPDETKPDTPPPRLPYSPGTNSQTAWLPGERRQILDHLSARIIDRCLPGIDIAIEYLRNKYSKNMSPNTLHLAGVVVLSFLNFLGDSGTNIFKITRHDISAFKGYEQEPGLKVNSVRSNLRGVYSHTGSTDYRWFGGTVKPE